MTTCDVLVKVFPRSLSVVQYNLDYPNQSGLRLVQLDDQSYNAVETNMNK